MMAYDFMDFGCGTGGSIEWAKARFGGSAGLGIDSNENDVKAASRLGHSVMLGSISEMSGGTLPVVRYVTMVHVLEHLANLDQMERVIKLAVEKATDFVFIKGPFFDGDDYLRGLGFKMTWSDWTGHPINLTTGMLRGLLQKMSLSGHFGVSQPVRDTSSLEILPLSAPRDQVKYLPEHGFKKMFRLEEVYREISCYIKVREIGYWNSLIASPIE